MSLTRACHDAFPGNGTPCHMSQSRLSVSSYTVGWRAGKQGSGCTDQALWTRCLSTRPTCSQAYVHIRSDQQVPVRQTTQ